MMSTDELQDLLEVMTDSIMNNQFVKLTLSEQRNAESELKSVRANLIVIKNSLKLKVVFVYKTREITKNYEPADAAKAIRELLEDEFRQANLFTTREHRHLVIKKQGEIKVKRMTYDLDRFPQKSLLHDKQKKQFVPLYNNVYLTELEVTRIDGAIRRNMEGKYRQINKYVEIVDGIIRQAKLPPKITVTDMGSGKGYLTFALYDHLHNTLNMDVEMRGIEFREELVDATNVIALKAGFDKLKFITGNIAEVEIMRSDVLIALHACDTATDDAIYRGILQKSSVIICAPCCHKQIRKQMEPVNALKQIAQHGILAERLAEMVTDTIRAMILEAFGYKTRVFEFIPLEHTAKNVMIAAVKTKDVETPDAAIIKEIAGLKKMFNIEYHHLEKLLDIHGKL
jgi:hypothetical protein